jgi:hypothetical protein
MKEYLVNVGGVELHRKPTIAARSAIQGAGLVMRAWTTALSRSQRVIAGQYVLFASAVNWKSYVRSHPTPSSR